MNTKYHRDLIVTIIYFLKFQNKFIFYNWILYITLFLPWHLVFHFISSVEFYTNIKCFMLKSFDQPTILLCNKRMYINEIKCFEFPMTIRFWVSNFYISNMLPYSSNMLPYSSKFPSIHFVINLESPEKHKKTGITLNHTT